MKGDLPVAIESADVVIYDINIVPQYGEPIYIIQDKPESNSEAQIQVIDI